MEIVLKSKDCLNKPEFFYKIFRESLKIDGIITSNGMSVSVRVS